MSYSPRPSHARFKSRFRTALALLATALMPLTAGAQKITPAGPDPVYLDDAENVRIVEQGTGWQRLSVTDPDDASKASEELYAVWPHGLSNAPLSEAQKQELSDDFAAMGAGGSRFSKVQSTQVVLIHKGIADAMENGTSLSPWASYAEPESGYLGCSGWKTKTETETWDFDEESYNHQFTLPGTNINGNFQIQIPITGQGTMELTYSYKRNFLCIPYKLRFDQVRLYGGLTVTGDSLLDASVTLNGHWEKEWLLAEPEIASFTVWVGPLPLRFNFDLPIHAGYMLDASLEGSLSVGTDLDSIGTFDYTCTRDTCWGSSNFTNPLDENGVTGSLEFRAQAEAYAKVKLRAELYDESFLYAEAGIKGYLEADIWGYYGNNCGDGDGNGVNETVRALVAGADGGYDWIYGIGGIINDREWTSPGNRFYLGWWDLLGTGGSTALSPMIQGPSNVTVGVPAEYTVRMRPCYPYDEAVTFGMAPSEWSGDFVIDDPSSGSETVSKIFGSPQAYDLRAMTVRDAKGRVIHVPQWRRIWAQNPVPPPALVLSYIPAGGGPRATHRSTDSTPNPTSKRFFYDPALGNFEERAEGACYNGSNNSTYVKVSYDGPTISSCTYRSHVDGNTYTCSASLIADLNAGKELILNTDSYEISPSTCNLSDPLSAVCPVGTYCWVRLEFVADGESHSRTVAYRK